MPRWVKESENLIGPLIWYMPYLEMLVPEDTFGLGLGARQACGPSCLGEVVFASGACVVRGVKSAGTAH